MKQSVLVVGGLVAFLVVVGMGYGIGQLLTMGSDLSGIEERLASVEKGGGSGKLNAKIGVVRVNDIALKLQEDPKIKAQLEQQSTPISNKLIQLKAQLDSGKMSQEEYVKQAEPLNTQLQKIFQETLLRPIQNAVNQVGESGNYDVVVKVEDVILFARSNIMEDVTERVWSQIQANR